MWRELGRWPLVLAAIVCIALGVWLISKVPNGNLGAATVLLVIGAILLGAFLATYLTSDKEK